MICKRCGNSDPDYFYKGSKGYYCRKCVNFKRLLLTEELKPLEYSISDDISEYHFDYPLTIYQKEISLQCLHSIIGSDVLLHCVCGAGKTEIVVDTINSFLSLHLKVCYAISRKEVVKELYLRFKRIFPFAKVIALYGGNTSETIGDLIVCTTHQLFRYYQTFDLLILDEVDAFPLNGNKELMNIALNSSKGRIIFSTATINDFLKEYINKRNVKELNLYIRPSLKPLIEPKMILGPMFFLLFYLLILMKRIKGQCIIFVTSIKECEVYYHIFSKLFNCTYAHSKLINESDNINDFKNKQYQFIFSTTVLERGISIKDVNVIVLNFNKSVFNKENLIQMFGRVGRNINNPYGEAYLLTTTNNNVVKDAIKEIKEANKIYEMSILRQNN